MKIIKINLDAGFPGVLASALVLFLSLLLAACGNISPTASPSPSSLLSSTLVTLVPTQTPQPTTKPTLAAPTINPALLG